MSTHNIHFPENIEKNPKISLNICFLELSKKIPTHKKRVRISHGKRAIGFRAIEIRLYLMKCSNVLSEWQTVLT